MEYEILFLPSNRAIHVKEGESLLKAASKAGILIDGSCSGNGTCGACRVQIASGNAGPLTSIEKQMFDCTKNNKWRLACQIFVTDDLVVSIPSLHGGSDRKKNMNVLPDWFEPKPATRKYEIEVPRAVIETQVNDLQRIRETLVMEGLQFHPMAIRRVQQAIAARRGKMTVTMQDDFVIDAEAGSTEKSCYGMAFDIGTTTVVGSLWNLTNGTMIDVEAETNPQSVFGADVISRIQYCIAEKGGTEELQRRMIGCINELIARLATRSNIKEEAIYELTVVGNTTMSHIFWGVSPKSMSRIPFAPVFCEGLQTEARNLDINSYPLGKVRLLPNIAGHVGSDITGVMITSDIFALPGNTIVIDIGTNGEILAAMEGKVCACSTAAGPAFEGASIRDGMRAAEGAIEKVTLEEDVTLQTVGSSEAVGICGSGLIDAISELIKIGLLSKTGSLRSRDEAKRRGLPEAIYQRIKGEGIKAYFVLGRRMDGSEIAVTQEDIREVQLAKGAIIGGMRTLMKKLEFNEDAIDRVILAGAFGNYIRKESAVRIGLLPDIEEEKIISIGNGAGSGAAMALLSANVRLQAQEQVKEIQHVELAKDPDFQDLYIDGMLFEKALE